MRRALIVGAGGLGTPASIALALAGVERITIVDDDRIELSNLHRQIAFQERDIGKLKAEVLATYLHAIRSAGASGETDPSHSTSTRDVNVRIERCTPENALALVGDHDVVLDGADNMATKFLLADACAIAKRALVSAGVVRMRGWVFASRGTHPCLRCVFEDIPRDRVETCSVAGVLGPLVGVIGGVQAQAALQLLTGDDSASGTLVSFDAGTGKIRRLRIRSRSECALCNGSAPRLDVERYSQICD